MIIPDSPPVDDLEAQYARACRKLDEALAARDEPQRRVAQAENEVLSLRHQLDEQRQRTPPAPEPEAAPELRQFREQVQRDLDSAEAARKTLWEKSAVDLNLATHLDATIALAQRMRRHVAG